MDKVKVYLLTKASYDWNEPIGVFSSLEYARNAVNVKEWFGNDADGIEYPIIDRALVPNRNNDAYLITEMVIDDVMHYAPKATESTPGGA